MQKPPITPMAPIKFRDGDNKDPKPDLCHLCPGSEGMHWRFFFLP